MKASDKMRGKNSNDVNTQKTLNLLFESMLTCYDDLNFIIYIHKLTLTQRIFIEVHFLFLSINRNFRSFNRFLDEI